jgi:uncharacterized membrane protein
MNSFDKNNPDLWKWALFYYNPKDPSIWVEKRSTDGWTLNFARFQSYLICALFLLLAFGMEIYLRR